MRLVYIALGWSSGMILTRHGIITSPETWLAIGIILTALVAINRHNQLFLWWNVFLLAMALGGWRYALIPQSSVVAQFNNTGGLTLSGIVSDIPDRTDTRTLLRVEAEAVTDGVRIYPVSGAVLVQAPRGTGVQYGDRIHATGSLYTPPTYDAFGYADYLARQGVYSLMDRVSVEIVSSGHGSPFRAALIDLREGAKAIIDRALPEPQAGLLTAILTGNRRGIESSVSTAYQRTGAAHLLAISGFNMVIIAGMVHGALRLIFSDRTWPPVILACAIIIVYALFTGGAPPVLRAALMSSLLFIGQGFGRKVFVPASIAFAVIVLSAINPNALWDISFQLSLLAVLGLAFLVNPLDRLFRRGLVHILPQKTAHGIATLLQGPLIVTLAAQIAVTPLILFVFGQVSGAFLLVNALVIPAHAYVLIFGWLALITFFIPLLSQVLFWIAFVFLTWTVNVIRGFAALPIAELNYPVTAQMVGLLYMIVLGVAMAEMTQARWWRNFKQVIRTRWIASTLGFVGLALFILIVALWNTRPNGRLDVWFLDVGHNNAVLIQTPDGTQILVDGGAFPSRLLTAIGDRIPFNDRRLEVIIVTQPDDFRIAGVTSALERYRAGIVLTNGQINFGDNYGDFLRISQEASESGLQVVRAGYQINFSDGVMLEILHPQDEPLITDSSADQVIVVRVTYGDVSFLLTGNLSADGQTTLLANGVWPRADVMQLPAHGAHRGLNAAFLRAVAPSAIIIQADAANRRNEPDERTLDIIPPHIPIYRTDETGTRHFWTDGTTLWTTQDD